MTADRDVDAVVLGGGVAGLTAAFELTRRGLRPVVVEAGAALGGVVGRHVVAGVTLDRATESYAVARPAVDELIADLGIADLVQRPRAGAAWVYHEHGTAPLPPGGWLGVPTALWSPEVRRVIGTPAAARAVIRDRRPPGDDDLADGTTLGALVRRRMGAAVVERLVEPVVGGVHAADPDDLELTSIAPGLPDALRRTGSLAAAAAQLRGGAGPAGSAVAGLRGGMYELVVALERAVVAAGGQVRRSSRAVPSRLPDGRWQLADLTTARLVLAVDGRAAGELLPAVLPGLDRPTTDLLAATGTDITLVTLVLDAPELDPAPRGTGVLVAARNRELWAKALTHASAKWAWLADDLPPGRHVVRLSYGRAGQATPRPAAAVNVALSDARTLFGLPGLREQQVVGTTAVRLPGALPAHRPGHAAAVERVRQAAAGVPGLAVVGGYLAGTGLAAVVGDARQAVRGLP